MSQIWKTFGVLVSAFAVGTIGVYIWKKKRRSFVKVGKISKLFFFPVKSLKAIEVSEGYCWKFGFEVEGVLDRSFMLINAEGVLVSQRQAPSLVLFTQSIRDKTLHILAPTGDELNVKIKDSVTPGDKILTCSVFTDTVNAVDCGDEAAAFFQKNLKISDVRLVRYFPSLPERKYTKKDPFYSKLKKDHPVSFQDLSAIHSISQASVDDLNSKMEGQQISVLNFRPNILISGCEAFAEDSWRILKFNSGAELSNLLTADRCLLTTNDPDTGMLSQKEPLVTLRKYRIHKDPEFLKKVGTKPCIGIYNAVLKPGVIRVGEEIMANLGPQPEMVNKLDK